jgi:glycosyltransferase 2 family protein
MSVISAQAKDSESMAASSQPPSRARHLWNVTWRVLVCLILLAWLFHNIFMKEGSQAALRRGIVWDALARAEQWKIGWHYGPIELWHNLSIVNFGAFALSVLIMGLSLVVGIARWRTVLRVQGLDLSWGRATEISLVAHFFNSFLLGSTGGDLMKAFYAARETHHKKTEAVVTVFVDRLAGLWAMLLFACFMMLPNLSLLFEHAKLRSVALLVLVMSGACSVFLVLAFWGGVSKRWSGAREWLRRLPKGAWIERSLDSCRQFGRERFFVLRILSMSMVLNALCVFQVMTVGWGLNLSIPPVALFVIVPMIICIAALPITPSGLGVRESLFVLMLSEPSINVPETSALSLSLLTLTGSLFWSLVGGVVYVTLKQRHHLTEKELATCGSNQ